ncbi:MAG: hypothetical protein Q9191_005187 [Dirinaria sp. TL-2023a]
MASFKGTFILTGANGGLGAATVTRFLESPESQTNKGVFTVRNPATADAAKSALHGSPNAAQHEIVPLDMSTLAGVRTGAAEINRKVKAGEFPPIRALVLNAAVQDAKGQKFTEDGFESHFGVNYLANWLLVLLLLQSMDPEEGRIIIVASWSHDARDPRNAMFIKREDQKTIWRNPEDMAYEKITDNPNELYEAGYRRFELQRRLASSSRLSNISVVSVDPGAMPNTGLVKDASPMIQFLLHYVLGSVISIVTWLRPNGDYRTPWKSAGDLLNASFNETDYGKHPQALYLNGSAKAKAGAEARNEQYQKEMWKASVRMARLEEGDTVLENWQ